MAKAKPFDPSNAALREVVRYELTQVTGPLEFRINHLLKALNDRAILVEAWDKRQRQMKKRTAVRSRKYPTPPMDDHAIEILKEGTEL